ncbi:MAG TPA: sortase [Candidatus Dojkabacteria bacterium]|nr:sortase [Candidatus Dojkabacteria bacterium]
MKKVGNKLIIFMILLLSLVQIYQIKKGFESLTHSDSVKNNPIEANIKDIPTLQLEDETAEEELLPDRIVIEKLNLDLPVTPVELQNGTWEVKPNVANYALGTDLIKESGGNVGIYGHALKGIFLNIKDLKPGDRIILYSNQRKAIYQVTQSSIVLPEQVDVFHTTSKPTVTLVTCDGIYSEKRYIVTASLIIKE